MAAEAVETDLWRIHLLPGSRQRIVNKITDMLQKHLPFSGQEGLLELRKISVRYEQKIYDAAISQSDYLRKISLKMLSMETKSYPYANALQPNHASDIENSHNRDSMDFSSLAENKFNGDWQEDVFQKIKSMNEMYHSDLNDMYLSMSVNLKQPMIKELETLIMFIRTNKEDIRRSHKEVMFAVEKQIISILNSNTPHEPVSALQIGHQPPQSEMHSLK